MMPARRALTLLRQQLQAEIEKLEAEAAEHALAFQKVIGERAADRSSSGRLRRLRRQAHLAAGDGGDDGHDVRR